MSIKTSIIGQDKDNTEFWFFKDDPSKLFIKKHDKDHSEWWFIDREDEFEHLYESLNTKGIKEKKLQENLKKIRTSLKLKKSKTPKIEDKSNEDVEMKDEGEEDQTVEKEAKDGERHHLYENDDYQQTIINATWYNKTMPKKRGNYNIGMRGTRGRAKHDETEEKEQPQLTLESLKS